MVLSENNLEKWVSVETKEQEISRIRNAKKGDVLFEGTTKQCFDIPETLIYMSESTYCKGVTGMTVTYYKA